MEVIDDVDLTKLYDAVPLKSGVVGGINDNRILLADNTVDMQMSPLVLL